MYDSKIIIIQNGKDSYNLTLLENRNLNSGEIRHIIEVLDKAIDKGK
ncbi:hypothetical protein [uncultured Tenacibaculum sp.]|nr:hypothetical protein [uncultured Tenacibaculum sp.]